MSNSIFVKDGTAQGVAKQRLIETIASPDKRVINDPYADSFVIGSGFMKLMGHKLNAWLSEKLAPGFHEHLIARTKFIDELIEKRRDSLLSEGKFTASGGHLALNDLGGDFGSLAKTRD